MKKWKCTVCGYVHEGKYPPEVCPVCGTVNYRFILDEPMPPELDRAVRAAFGAETKAYVRNQAFAKVADREDHPQVARLFRAVAEAERIHATEYLKFLVGVIGSTEENLRTAFESEVMAHTEGYAPLIKVAIEAKREDVTWSFSRARDVEDRHAKLYKETLTALASEREVDYHVCQVCGYVFDGPLPDDCPVCKASRENFARVA